MADEKMIEQYNYKEFIPEEFEPWLNFSESPPLGTKVVDFPLWAQEDHTETGLLRLLQQSQYTIVEFGSFT